MTVKRYDQIIHNGVMEPMPDGKYVTYSDYQKLVAENVALKNRTVKVPAKVYVKDMKSNVVRWAQVIDALSDAGVAFARDDGELIAGTRETPATDAAIAEIVAIELEKLGEIFKTRFTRDLYESAFLGCIAPHAANLRAGRKG